MVRDGEKTVMLIDDEESLLTCVSYLLKSRGIKVHSYTSAEGAMDAYRNILPDLVLTDLNMPGMNGMDLLREIRTMDSDTPVIIITGYADLDLTIEAVRLKACNFLLKPCEPEELLDAVISGIEDARRARQEKCDHAELELAFSRATRELVRVLEIQKEVTRELIDRLTIAAELRDEETGAHNVRIGRYVHAIARHLGLPEDFVEAVSAASPMHDVGKIVIPDAILFKPGPLTAEEFEILKSHTTVGEQIFRGSRHRQLQLAASIALTHHERWDGSGYPRGLKGEDIPLEGRIVMLADQYDALRSRRVYKLPLDHRAACKVILEGDHLTRPEHFDPDLLQAFREMSPLMAEIFDRSTEPVDRNDDFMSADQPGG